MKTALNLTAAIVVLVAFLLMLDLVLAGRESHPTPCSGPFVCLVVLDTSQVRVVR